MLNQNKIWQAVSSSLRRIFTSPLQLAGGGGRLINHEDLFRPTAGRWLWDEKRQLELHTRRFDVKALGDVVARALNAENDCSHKIINNVTIQKLAEGGSNKVFTASVRRGPLSGQRVVVKIPDPVVPAQLVTASEVATLEYLRTELDVPVPKVLAWSSTSDNPVGSEYIVMEEAAGDPLYLQWDTKLEVPQKIVVVEQLLSIQKRILQHTAGFGGYGSLYFTEDALALGLARHPVSTNASGRFCLGPLADRKFLSSVDEYADTKWGPCEQSPHYPRWRQITDTR
jgi:hypothetical protein